MVLFRSKGRILAFVFVLGLNGCLAGGVPENPSGTSTPTEALPETPPSTESSALAETSTPTPWDWRELADQADSTQAIQVANGWNHSVEMRVVVTREHTDETVHNASYHVTPGTDRTVYDVSAADPDGIEPFTVVVMARNTTKRTTLKTNKCYAGARAEIRQDGSLSVYQVLC